MCFEEIIDFHYIDFIEHHNHDEYFIVTIIAHLKLNLIHLFKLHSDHFNSIVHYFHLFHSIYYLF